MRVLANSPDLAPIGGVELCTEQVGVALAGRGHQVDVLFARDGSLRERYEQAGVTLHRVPNFDVDPRHVARDLRSFGPSIRYARRVRHDVLWLSRFEQIMWAQSVARSARVPIVCHLHHGPNYRLTKELSCGVRHFIAVSHFIRETWMARGITPDRITVIHNAVPTELYPPADRAELSAARQRLTIPDGAYVVAFLGRMVAEKGVDVLADAWRSLGLDAAEGRLLLVGRQQSDDPSYIRHLESSTDRATTQWLPMGLDALTAMHAADVVVVPSRWPEPFGRVVIEALSTARPVVASRVGGIPEILTGPLARFLVDPDDPALLRRQLAELRGWRDREPTLGHDCAKWVTGHFAFTSHVDAVERVLSAVAR